MKSTFCSLIFCLVFLNSYSQALLNDSINQYDTKNKKNGKWIEYLDSLFQKAEKSNASFYRYNYYEHGKIILKFHEKHFKNARLLINGNSKIKDSIVVLNGLYTWYDSENRIIGKEQYKNGIRSGKSKFYEYRKYICIEVLDWNNKYQNQEWSYYFEMYSNIFNLDIGDVLLVLSGFYGKGDKGWKMYEKKTNRDYYKINRVIYKE